MLGVVFRLLDNPQDVLSPEQPHIIYHPARGKRHKWGFKAMLPSDQGYDFDRKGHSAYCAANPGAWALFVLVRNTNAVDCDHTLMLLALLLTLLRGSIDTNEFTLHKFMKPVGEEAFSFQKSEDGVTTNCAFHFNDRGTTVAFISALTIGNDGKPKTFTLKGNTSRSSTADYEVHVTPEGIQTRIGKETKTSPVPKVWYLNAGYAPASMQQALIQFWKANGKPEVIQTFPQGEVRISDSGTDDVQIGTKTLHLERYGVEGVVWGHETLWINGDDLMALVTRDAEFDHFEAIRKGYESGLPFFVTKAGEEGMQVLADLSEKSQAVVRPTGVKTSTSAFLPKAASAKKTLLILNARIVNTDGTPPIEKGYILVSEGKIRSFGALSTAFKAPTVDQTFDAKGMTVLPGLWDMHAHFEQVEWGPIYLAAGVTTIRDCGNETEFVTSVRKVIDSGGGIGPRMLLAGLIDGPGKLSLGVNIAATEAEAVSLVDGYKAKGFDQIKIYSSVAPDVVSAICNEAHRVGLKVTGHVPEGMKAADCVERGMDMINHIHSLTSFKAMMGAPPTENPDIASLVDILVKHGTVIDPTVALMEEQLHDAKVPFAQLEPGVARLPEGLKMTVPPGVPANISKAVDWMLQLIGLLHKKGIPIVAGTDQAVPGFSLWRELELYVKAGLSPMEALQSATIVPARVMGHEKDSGTIAVGKRADLVMVEGAPDKNIGDIRNARFTVATGRLFRCAPLWEAVGFKSD